MSIKDFVKDLKKQKNTELNNLYKKPVPEKRSQMPITQVFEKNIYHQADILYMPEDKQYKYILVVVDLYDGAFDAVKLKIRDNETILKAFDKIYGRKYLNYPKIITLDQGSEFKDKTEEYFKKHKTIVKYALTGRHRQLSNVERLNQKIGTILFKRMTTQELLTGEPSKEWINDLKPLVKTLNKPKNRKIPLKTEIYPDPITDKFTGNLLKIGQKVKIKLDYPINTTDQKRLNGKFRSTDIKWTPETYKINEVLLKPSYPPMYLTSNDDNVARTKNQLQPITGNEIEPDIKYIRTNTEYYIISKILDKRINNRKTEYLVKWKGFKDENNSWVSAQELDRTKELKQMKRDYNAGIN